jgi:uncharacterized protein YecE (DUF72 family)
VNYIGTAGWNIPRAHRDRFPAGGSQLQRYATLLTGTEINTSFYRSHAAATYERWGAGVPASFRFAVKLPKVLTHERSLEPDRDALARFLDEIAGLGSKIGPILIQLPPSLTFEERRVAAFFELLRASFTGAVVCEPRHPTWAAAQATPLFVSYEIARVAADPPRAPGLSTPGGWSGLVYYRLHGSPQPYFSTYPPQRITDLAARLRAATVPAWCIFDNTGSGAAAANALELVARVTGRVDV